MPNFTVQGVSINVQLPFYCPHPYFMMRGFGEEASIIVHGARSDPPLVGNVMIDVTLVTCNAFNLTTTDCLLPEPISVYRRVHMFPGSDNNERSYVWKRRQGVSVDPTTRYQSTYCSRQALQDPERKRQCMRSSIDAYSFIAPNVTVDGRVCFIGKSHANRLFYAARDLGMETQYITVKFVRNLKAAANVARGCRYAIIHVGQWDLGYPENHFTPVVNFVSSLNRGLSAFKMRGIKTTVVSMHYNPLGDYILSCPPRDWRRPDYVDTYNALLEKSARAYGFLFVDNNARINGVAWDSAPDWCHYDSSVFTAIVKYTLHVILANQSSIKRTPNQRQIQGHTSTAIKHIASYLAQSKATHSQPSNHTRQPLLLSPSQREPVKG